MTEPDIVAQVELLADAASSLHEWRVLKRARDEILALRALADANRRAIEELGCEIMLLRQRAAEAMKGEAHG